MELRRLGKQYRTDAVYRTRISLNMSLFANLMYVGLNAAYFIIDGSAWFAVLAVYYIILSVMRFLLVRYIRKTEIGKNRVGELKRAVVCSHILLSLNFALSGAVLMMLYRGKGFEYRGLLIYAAATYTFYITVHAIVSLVRYRRYNSPVITTSKIIALSSALVSMLSLETAMLSQFGTGMAEDTKRLFIVLTGAGVSVAVVAMSVYMTVRSAKEIKKIKEQNYGQ